MKHHIAASRTSFGTLAQYLQAGDLLVGYGAVIASVQVGSVIRVEVESIDGAKLPRLEFTVDENVTIR